MKRMLYLLLFTFLGCGSIQAQGDEFNSKNFTLTATWLGVEHESFFGPTLDFNVLRWKKSNSPTIGFGFGTGVLMTKINIETPIFLAEETFSVKTNYRVEGYVYLIPLESYYLLGFREDFIDFGFGAQLAGFSGSSEADYLNEHYEYNKNSLTVLFAPHIGFRHQPVGSGAFFRLLWKPTWNVFNDAYASCYQLSLGYSL